GGGRRRVRRLRPGAPREAAPGTAETGGAIVTGAVKARALPPGGTVGIAGTSSPWEQRSDVDRAVRWWESRGYRVKLGSGVFDRANFLTMADPERTEFTHRGLLRAFTSAEPLGAVAPRPDDPYVGAMGTGRATAPLVGGCLWLLRETLATPWEVDLRGTILFFEDVHCPPWHLDGMLTQLRNAGKLEHVAGFVIGEFAESDPTKERNPWLRSKSFEDVAEEH